MRLKPGGRVASLLSWGLLVGGVSVLMTFPDAAPPRAVTLAHLPGAILFALAGLVFGLSHPEGRAWAGAPLLGWLPALFGLLLLLRGDAPPAAVWLVLALGPALLAGAGARAGAAIARRRTRP